MKKSITRVIEDKNSVLMDKQFLHDANLSWKAKGIMAYVLTLPDDWTFHLEEIATHSTDGETSFLSGWKELKDQGYIKRVAIRNGKTIIRWETHIFVQKQHLEG